MPFDCGYFGGYIKPANHLENRRDRRLAKNQNGKRRVVVVVREQGGRTLPAVFKSESAALGWIAGRVTPSTRLTADEAETWNDLHARHRMDRIDHVAAYSLPGGVCTIGAEEFFSRMRGPRSAIITTSPGHTLFATRRSRSGATIVGGRTTAVSGPGRRGAGDGLQAVRGLVRLLAADAIAVAKQPFRSPLDSATRSALGC